MVSRCTVAMFTQARFMVMSSTVQRCVVLVPSAAVQVKAHNILQVLHLASDPVRLEECAVVLTVTIPHDTRPTWPRPLHECTLSVTYLHSVQLNCRPRLIAWKNWWPPTQFMQVHEHPRHLSHSGYSSPVRARVSARPLRTTRTCSRDCHRLCLC